MPRSNTPLHPQVAPDPLTAVAECAFSIARLPAVPALDWCECAARALLPTSSSGTVVVVVADVRFDGAISRWHASSVVKADRPLREGERYAAEPPAMSQWITGRHDSHESEPTVIDVDAASVPVPLHGAERCVACRLPLHDQPDGRSLLVYTGQTPEHTMLHACGVIALILRQVASRALAERQGGIPWLTPREQQVLDGLIMGLSIRQIADRFHRSPHTVHDHVKGLHDKLGASNRAQLVSLAMGGWFMARE